MKFNEKIVRLRKIKGITQDELASAVGVSRQAVYKWECGQSYPEVQKLIEIKALFGISIDDLLDESYEIAMPEKKRRKRISKASIEKIEKAVESDLYSEAKEEPVVVEVEAVPVEVDTTAHIVYEAERIVEEVAIEEPVAVAIPTVEEAPVAEAMPEAEDEPRRRGFFSRIFGRK